MDKYEYFRKFHFMNKEDIISAIDSTLASVLKNAETDPRHSCAFYATLKNLLDEFKKSLDNIVFIEKLDDGWCYDWGVSYSGADLQLIHYRVDDSIFENPHDIMYDQIFTLSTTPTKLLTVEEYAQMQGVEVVTVRQWIRRGKIRTAKKFGKEWRIPALTDTPGRGYTSAWYEWSDGLIGLPKELEFLNKYCSAMIVQDDEDKKYYHVHLYNGDAVENGVGKIAKVIRCTVAEREKIELALISQPAVKYMSNLTDSICIDLMNIK